MTPRSTPRTRHRRARPRRPQEGLVLISVMLVIVMGTAIAMTTARDTRYALRSAGHDRADLQGRYAAEGTLMATIAWFDFLEFEKDFERMVFREWTREGAGPPDMLPWFPEPPIPLWQAPDAPSTMHAPARVNTDQLISTQRPGLEVLPHTKLGDPVTVAPGVDETGVFGESQFVPTENYFVDLYDCVTGEIVKVAGQDKAPQRCMVTARFRNTLLAGSPSALWRVGDRLAPRDAYAHDQFARLHNASAIIDTVPIAQ